MVVASNWHVDWFDLAMNERAVINLINTFLVLSASCSGISGVVPGKNKLVKKVKDS